MNKTPLVSICSLTYNHAPYIRQCLDGLLMQQTNFPFEIIINDDCSTDGTTEIIRDYAERFPEIIKPIFHEENQYQKGLRGFFQKFVFPKAQGKYIALCEGDDYWTDPLKLQKQVDFLESHLNYGMVYTDINEYSQKTRKFLNKRHKIKSGECFSDRINDNIDTSLLTLCFRRHIIEELPKVDTKKYFTGDIFLTLYITSKYKIYGFNEKMCTYRILEESASHHINRDIFRDSKIAYQVSNTYLYFINHTSKQIENYDSICFKHYSRVLRYHLIYNNLKEFQQIQRNISGLKLDNKQFLQKLIFIFLQNSLVFKIFRIIYIFCNK